MFFQFHLHQMPNNRDTHESSLAIGGVCVFFRSDENVMNV